MMSSRIGTILMMGFAIFTIALAFVFLGHSVSGVAPGDRHVMTRSQRPSRAAANSSRERWSENIRRCIATGDSIGMQALFSKWFEKDPVAVRDWLARQKSLMPLQPALVQITRDISAANSPVEALKWAELLEPGPERDQALFEIYATGRRYGSLTEEEIRRAPFTPRQIESLLSGAADD